MLVHVEIPGMSLNLQDPLLRLTGIHPRQTGGIPIGQVFTDCARDGGVRPIRLPGSGTGPLLLWMPRKQWKVKHYCPKRYQVVISKNWH